MSTQIQPTPIVTGESAKKIEEQLKIEPSEETERGIEILKEMFKNQKSVDQQIAYETRKIFMKMEDMVTYKED